MSTRAQIAIQIGPEEWAHTYVHYDGYPSHMLPALAPWGALHRFRAMTLALTR